MTNAEETKTHFRTGHLCEATCGLEITTKGAVVVRIRGDQNDVFSRGFICPKGSTIKDLDGDPDRVRHPMIRHGETWRQVSWEEAFAEIDRRFRGVKALHPDPRSSAIYFGNPTAHNISSSLYLRSVMNALKTTNVFSASTVDQMPKQISAALMFGAMATIPVPDLDRTDYLVILGANPWESNGSVCTAPDFPGRVDAIRAAVARSSWSTRGARRLPSTRTGISRSGPALTLLCWPRWFMCCSPMASQRWRHRRPGQWCRDGARDHGRDHAGMGGADHRTRCRGRPQPRP